MVGEAGDRIALGDAEIIALRDTSGRFPLAGVFPDVPASAWPHFRERFPTAFDGESTWLASFTAFIVRTAGRVVLVDTGVGPGPVAALGGLRGALPEALARHTIAPGEIDTVFLSHLHLDHVGWNLTPDGAPTFPNARYLVGRSDWEAFSREAERLPYLATTVTPLAALGVLDLLDGETDLGAGLTAVPTPGHTPGHLSLRVTSGGQHALITGEVATHPAQITEDSWRFVADTDAPLATATRRHILDWAEATGALLAVAHFPFPGFGRVVRSDCGRVWVVE